MCTDKCGTLEFSRCAHEVALDRAPTAANAWQRHGRRLVMASALVTGSLGLLGAGQAAAADCIDTDGDGYGWDGSATCDPNSGTFASSNAQSTPDVAEVGPCVDTAPFNDAWGWNGQESCRLDVASNPAAICIDVGEINDGWGWNGTEPCQLPITDPPTSNSDLSDQNGGATNSVTAPDNGFEPNTDDLELDLGFGTEVPFTITHPQNDESTIVSSRHPDGTWVNDFIDPVGNITQTNTNFPDGVHVSSVTNPSGVVTSTVTVDGVQVSQHSSPPDEAGGGHDSGSDTNSDGDYGDASLGGFAGDSSVGQVSAD